MVAVIIIPSTSSIGTISIDLVCISSQIIDVIDSMLAQDFVALGKYREAHLTFFGYIPLSGIVGDFLYTLFQGGRQLIGNTRYRQCLRKQLEVFVLGKLTCNQSVGTTDNLIHYVKHTIFQFVVHAGNSRIGIQHRITSNRVNGCIDISTKHGIDGHTIGHVYRHHFRIGKMEQGNVIAQ